jgi:hypothetical protein
MLVLFTIYEHTPHYKRVNDVIVNGFRSRGLHPYVSYSTSSSLETGFLFVNFRIKGIHKNSRDDIKATDPIKWYDAVKFPVMSRNKPKKDNLIYNVHYEIQCYTNILMINMPNNRVNAIFNNKYSLFAECKNKALPFLRMERVVSLL